MKTINTRDQDVRKLVRDVLVERFPSSKIDLISVDPDIDSDGDKILRITVMLEESEGQLDKGRLVGFVRHLRSSLADAHREEFPLLSFVSAKDAKNMKLESV